MIRVAIVEDEAAVRDQLMGYVQRYMRQYDAQIEVTMFTRRCWKFWKDIGLSTTYFLGCGDEPSSTAGDRQPHPRIGQ